MTFKVGFYYIHDSLGINPSATVSFAYANNENPQTGNFNVKAQRWLNDSDVWENPLLPFQIFMAGIYNQVTLTLQDSIFNTSDWWTLVTSPLGNGLEEWQQDEYSIYPNPVFAGDEIKFSSVNGIFQPSLIRIFNSEGREIYHKKTGIELKTISISDNISPGIYTVQFYSDKTIISKRLLVLEH